MSNGAYADARMHVHVYTLTRAHAHIPASRGSTGSRPSRPPVGRWPCCSAVCCGAHHAQLRCDASSRTRRRPQLSSQSLRLSAPLPSLHATTSNEWPKMAQDLTSYFRVVPGSMRSTVPSNGSRRMPSLLLPSNVSATSDVDERTEDDCGNPTASHALLTSPPGTPRRITQHHRTMRSKMDLIDNV